MSELNSIKINGVDIPLEKVCEECEGCGEVGGANFSFRLPEYETYACPTCKGTGKEPIYYTPEQIEGE